MNRSEAKQVIVLVESLRNPSDMVLINELDVLFLWDRNLTYYFVRCGYDISFCTWKKCTYFVVMCIGAFSTLNNSSFHLWCILQIWETVYPGWCKIEKCLRPLSLVSLCSCIIFHAKIRLLKPESKILQRRKNWQFKRKTVCCNVCVIFVTITWNNVLGD